MAKNSLGIDGAPLTSISDRVLHCSSEDTEEVWRALVGDPGYGGWQHGLGKEIEKHRDALHSQESKDLFAWDQIERRIRAPGGMYFVGRFILDNIRLYRPLHDKKFGRTMEKIPGTRSRVYLLCERGIYKSVMTGFIFPIYVLGTRPTETILASGPNTKSSEEILNTVRMTIENNDRLRTLFPHLQPAYSPITGRMDAWSSDRLITEGYRKFGRIDREPTRREGSLMSCGAEESPTRLHPTLWLFDDLINLKNSESDIWVTKVIRFVREVVANLGAGQMPMVGSGTCWRGDDLSARILSGEISAFKTILIPMYKKEKDKGGKSKKVYALPRAQVIKQLPKWQQAKAKKGGMLYCGYDEVIEASIRADLSDYEFACQHMCDPAAREVKSFSDVNFLTFSDNHPPWAFIDGLTEARYAMWVDSLYLFAVIDYATKRARDADSTVCWMLGVDNLERLFILDGVYDKMESHRTHEMLMQLFLHPYEEDALNYWMPRPVWDGSKRVTSGYSAQAWRPNHVAIEKGALSNSLTDGMRSICRVRGVEIPWQSVQIQGGDNPKKKHDRIFKRLSRPYHAQRIKIRRDIIKPSLMKKGQTVNVTEALRREYGGFGDSGVPDDGLDSLSIGSQWFTVGGEAIYSEEDERAVALRRWTEHMFKGVFTTADDDSARRYGVAPGQMVPDEADVDASGISIDWKPNES